MKYRTACAVILMSLGTACLWGDEPKPAGKPDDANPPKAAEPAAEDPAHQELRALRDGIVAAINKNDLDAVMTFLDPDVVVTWQNGEVSRKPEGVKEYYNRVLKGPERTLESYSTSPKVDDLTHLYGNTGVAFGSSLDHYKLTDGTDFDLPTRWSATVVKTDGKWRIASFHASVNMFDNPVMRMGIKRVALWVAVIATAVGVLVGIIIARIFRKTSSGDPGPKTKIGDPRPKTK